MAFGPPVLVELKAEIGEFKAKLGEAEAEIEGLAKRGSSHFDQLATAGKGIALGLAGGGTAFGAFALKEADDYEKAHARLEAAAAASGHSLDEYKGHIGQVEKQFESFGYTHADVEDALQRMVTATQDPEKSLQNLGLAADIAKARNIDLASASDLVDKAMTGNLRALKQMGIDLPIAASSAEKLQVASDGLAQKQDELNQFLAQNPKAASEAGKAHDEYVKKLEAVQSAQGKVNDLQAAGGDIMGALSQRFGGQAATAANTFAGKMQALEARAKDWGVTVGLWLIPKIESLIKIISEVVDWCGKHLDVVIPLAAAIGTVLVAAFVAWAIAAAQAAIATLVALAPIIAVVAALAVLGAAIYEIWTHWDTIWGFIKKIVGDAKDWIVDHINWIIAAVALPLLPLKLLWDNWDAVWSAITDKLGSARDFMGAVFRDVVNMLSWVRGVFSAVWGDITGAVSTAWNFIVSVVADGANLLRAIINGIISAVDAIQIHIHVSTPGLSILGQDVIPDWSYDFDWNGLQIQRLHQGGIVAGPYGQEVPVMALGGERFFMPGSSDSSGGPIAITNVITLDGRVLARETREYTRAELLQMQRNGALFSGNYPVTT